MVHIGASGFAWRNLMMECLAIKPKMFEKDSPKLNLHGSTLRIT